MYRQTAGSRPSSTSCAPCPTATSCGVRDGNRSHPTRKCKSSESPGSPRHRSEYWVTRGSDFLRPSSIPWLHRHRSTLPRPWIARGCRRLPSRSECSSGVKVEEAVVKVRFPILIHIRVARDDERVCGTNKLHKSVALSLFMMPLRLLDAGTPDHRAIRRGSFLRAVLQSSQTFRCGDFSALGIGAEMGRIHDE